MSVARACVLLCLAAGAAGCAHDSDCSALHVCKQGDCEHKSLFPLAWQEYLGTLLIFCLLGMANASGLGGGVIMIPILMTIFVFPAHQTVALSLTIATVGAATAYISKIGSRRPKSTKPLVDYDIAMLMQPGLLLGTVYGVMLNVVFPGWLLLVLLTLLLIFMCYTSFQKGLKVFSVETQQKSAPQGALLPAAETPVTVKEPILPAIPVIGLLAVYGIALVYAFCAGGKNTDSFVGIESCSTGYWLLLAGYSLVCILLIGAFGALMMGKMKKALRENHELPAGDMPWSSRAVVGVAVCGLVAGVAGAMLGIGGGVIIGPLLLSYNINAQTTSATAIFMVLFGASISTIQYIVAGVLDVPYALFFVVVGIFGSLFGVIVIKWVVDKTQRSSIIIFVLAGILGLSSVVLPLFNIFSMIDQSRQGKLQIGFSSFCN